MTPLRDRPFYRLTRHFFNQFFDVPFLHDTGPEAVHRLVIGLLAVLSTAGRLLVRMYLAKYVQLSLLDTPEPYRQALLADDTLAIGLPMLVVAFATVLTGNSLLPDETDFRALMVLPVTERMIFGAKLAALTLFVALFIVGSHAAMGLFVLVISAGRWAESDLIPRLAAFVVAGVCGSMLVVLAVAALNGLCAVLLPPRRVYQGAAALRCGLLCALVVAIPFAARIPLLGPRLALGSPLVYAIPPAWFLGIERVLLGAHDRHLVTLATIGVAALAVAAVVACGTYVSLYRHFDQVVLRSSGEGRATAPSRSFRRARRRREERGASAAVHDFTRITLTRSALHQGIVAGLSACGVGVVVNALVGNLNGSLDRSVWSTVGLSDAILWAPFALMLATAFALRAAFSLPVDLGANWVFQMTEQAETRGEQLRVVERLMWTAVAVPLGIMLPFEWLVLGPRAVLCLAIGAPYGALLVELLLTGWQRIPFTCSYVPGKRFIGQTLALGLAGFWAFAGTGAFLVRHGLDHPLRSVLVIGTITIAAGALRRYRLQRWRQHALLFVDQLPVVVQRLGLSSH